MKVALKQPTQILVARLGIMPTRHAAHPWHRHPEEAIALAILLSLAERGLGGCIIKAFNAKQIQADFRLPDFLEVRTVLAIGRPQETVVIEPMSPDGDYRYWRDAAGVHHVPKRAVEALIWKEEL